jgi:hypothetical protein
VLPLNYVSINHRVHINSLYSFYIYCNVHNKIYKIARRYSHSISSIQQQSYSTSPTPFPSPLLKRGHRTLTQRPKLLDNHHSLPPAPQPQHLCGKHPLLLFSHIGGREARVQQSGLEVLLGQPRLRKDERAQGFAQRLDLRALGQPTDVKDEGAGEGGGKGTEDGEGRYAAGREGVGGARVGETQQGFLYFACG